MDGNGRNRNNESEYRRPATLDTVIRRAHPLSTLSHTRVSFAALHALFCLLRHRCCCCAARQMVGIWGWTFLIASVIFSCNESSVIIILLLFWDVGASRTQECGCTCTRPSFAPNFPLCVSSYAYCVRASSHTHKHNTCLLFGDFIVCCMEPRSMTLCEKRDAPIRFSSRRSFEAFCLFARSAHHEEFPVRLLFWPLGIRGSDVKG